MRNTYYEKVLFVGKYEFYLGLTLTTMTGLSVLMIQRAVRNILLVKLLLTKI